MQAPMTTEFESDKVLMRTLMNNFGTVLVFIFYSDANEQSKQFLTNFNNSIPIFGQHDNVKYFSLSAEKCPQTFKKFEIQNTPSVVFTQTDKKILQKDQSGDIGTIFDSLSTVAAEHKVQFEKDKAIWHPKVRAIVQSCPFIVFIKGTPENPKCGFTTTLLEILKQHSIQYSHYDIIEDEQMRYWVRHYSNWPTYPQIFINGKLIGGLDVVKDLVAQGEFQKLVPKSCKKSTAEERYNNFINEHKTIVFVDGFTFENKSSQDAVEQASQKYGENIYVYNISLDKQIKEYITKNVSQTVPFVVTDKNAVKKQ